MSQMTGDGNVASNRSMAQTIGYLFGATYLLVGLLGFAVTGGVGFAAQEGDELLGLFEINPLHNIVHLAIGAALVYGATKGVNAARAINTTVGATYLLVGILGLFITDSEVNILALNGADNLLHLGSAAILLTAGMMGPRTTASTHSSATRTTTGTGMR